MHIILILLTIGFAACGKAQAPAKAAEAQPEQIVPTATIDAGVANAMASEPSLPEGQWYRAELDFGEAGAVPFFLLLPPGDSGVGYYKNDKEIVEVDFRWSAEQLVIDGRWNYLARITATRAADGSLEGVFLRDIALFGHDILKDFRAAPIAKPDPSGRFPGQPSGKSFAGTWKFDFEEHGEGVGVFTQKGDVITGFVRPGSFPDLWFLAGNVREEGFKLSTFNGSAGHLVTASGDENSIKGMFSIFGEWNEGFTATRTDDAYRPTSKVKVVSKNGGLDVPELKAYRGKPTILFFFATWCHNCHDETVVLIELEKKYRAQGVKVLAITIDLVEDRELTEKQIAIYRKKYAVPWEILQRPSNSDEMLQTMPAELADWDGIPVTMFIGRDNVVHHVYGGWFSKAAVAEHAQLVQQFDTWTGEIAAAE